MLIKYNSVNTDPISVILHRLGHFLSLINLEINKICKKITCLLLSHSAKIVNIEISLGLEVCFSGAKYKTWSCNLVNRISFSVMLKYGINHAFLVI